MTVGRLSGDVSSAIARRDAGLSAGTFSGDVGSAIADSRGDTLVVVTWMLRSLDCETVRYNPVSFRTEGNRIENPKLWESLYKDPLMRDLTN